MPMIPPTVTAQEHKVAVRNGKPIFYQPSELKEAKAKLKSHLLPHRPEPQFTEGIQLVCKWLFPKGSHQNGEYRTTKPDTDTMPTT